MFGDSAPRCAIEVQVFDPDGSLPPGEPRLNRRGRRALRSPCPGIDVPEGLDLDRKRALVKAMYDAMHEVYPFPDDTRIFLREWTPDSVSQNGLLGSEPARPVFVVHIPAGGDLDARRRMLRDINAAVADAYHLPDFAIFLHEHSLETVVINGGILADDQQRVEDQTSIYGQ